MPPALQLASRARTSPAFAWNAFVRKSQPTLGDVHVNTPLTAISIAYIQAAIRFVADRVFPLVPVQKMSDRYYVYDRSSFFRNTARVRAPGSESAGGGFGLDNTPSYSATPIAIHWDIPDQIRANADSVLSLDRDGTWWVTQQLLLKREIDWAAKYFTTGVWTSDQTGVSGAPSTNQFLQWNDNSSTPVEDVEAQKKAISLYGYEPNKLVLGRDVFSVLKNHPDILDRIKYGGGPGNPAVVTERVLAEVFGVEEVLVGNASYETAAEGATSSLARILGKSALLLYAAPSPGLMIPSAGYTFGWTGLYGGEAYGSRISKFRMEWLKSDRVEGEMAYDQKVVAADLGRFFATAVA